MINPEAIAGASKEELEWALSVLLSRTFSFYSETGISALTAGPWVKEVDMETVVMAPFADFFNHGDRPSVEWKVELMVSTVAGTEDDAEPERRGETKTTSTEQPSISGSLVFSTLQDVGAGSELLISYGRKSNDVLLGSYGFVLFPNPDDDFILTEEVADVIDLFGRVQGKAQVDDEGKWPGPIPAFPTSTVWDSLGLTPQGVVSKCMAAMKELNVTELKEVQLRPGFSDEGDPRLYHLEDEKSLNKTKVWSGGDIDPRLLSIFAAFRFLEVEGREPQYAALIHRAAYFGFGVNNATCRDLAPGEEWSNALLRAFEEGTADLVTAIDLSLETFSTTLEADSDALQVLKECQRMEFRPNLEEGVWNDAEEWEGMDWTSACSEVMEAHQKQWELMLLYRISKKSVAEDAKGRLRERCLLLPDRNREPYHPQSG